MLHIYLPLKKSNAEACFSVPESPRLAEYRSAIAFLFRIVRKKPTPSQKSARGGVFSPYLGFYSEFSTRRARLDKVS